MALAQFPHRSQVEVEFKAFELDPAAGKSIGKNIHEAIAEKYGISMEEAKRQTAGSVNRRQAWGFVMILTT